MSAKHAAACTREGMAHCRAAKLRTVPRRRAEPLLTRAWRTTARELTVADAFVRDEAVRTAAPWNF